MPIPEDTELYRKAKEYADHIYSKPSAYKSGYIVKTYKEMGGKYKEDEKPKNLKRWFQEDWKDVGHSGYPVYRPTKKISNKTPLIPSEIDKNNLRKQIQLKQIYKGKYNLPPFQK
jgi:hypothetical protein